MKAAILFITLILFTSIGFSQTKKHSIKKKAPIKVEPLLKNSLDSISYAYGMELFLRRNVSLIKDMKARGITSLNYVAFNQAITDAIADKTPSLTPAQKLGATLKFGKTQFAANIAASDKFMADNKKQPGVITLPSGLQYTVLQEGNGPRLKATDTIITTNYALKLYTGKDIESTFGKKPFVLPAVKGVIPGWIEGLQLMNVGAKYRLFIPYYLAYGDSEASPEIPPYSALIFDVELLKIGK
jgi:FKBP-type peptidyl-prolyl cis-trans isomerase